MKQSYLKTQKRRVAPQQYKHDLGQNFLYDEVLLRRLVEATGIIKTEDVLEIGPGEGTLTEQLCLAARRVISVEVDSDLIPVLRLMQERYENLTIVEGDIRRIPFEETCASLQKPFHVIANIPYNITSPILELLFEHRSELCQIALMVQKEVAKKLTAVPGEEGYGLASVMAQYYAEVSIAEIIPKEMFTPSPKVDSAFVIMKTRKESLLSLQAETEFLSLVKCGFSLRRKTLQNALKSHRDSSFTASVLQELGWKEACRAEELSLAQWITFFNTILRHREANRP